MDEDVDQPGDFWNQVVGDAFEKIDIYGDYPAFLSGYQSVRPEVAHLVAGFWCQSEVRNGGFHQFFTNSTGILSPEALSAYRAIGLQEWALILEQAIGFFGTPYPRDRAERSEPLWKLWDEFEDDRERGDPFYKLDDRFFLWLHADYHRWDRAADEYVYRLVR